MSIYGENYFLTEGKLADKFRKFTHKINNKYLMSHPRQAKQYFRMNPGAVKEFPEAAKHYHVIDINKTQGPVEPSKDQYNDAVAWIKSFEKDKDDPTNLPPQGLYYENISNSKWKSYFNKHKSDFTRIDTSKGGMIEWFEDEALEFIRSNECYETGTVIDDISWLVYFPKLDKYMIYDENDTPYQDKNDIKLYTYNQIINYGKDWFTTINTDKYNEGFSKALIQADKDLGLNKLK